MATVDTVSMARNPQQDAQQLLQLGTGYIFSAALYPIAKLKIADLLADGPLPVAEIAKRTDSNTDALYRVLRVLASVGVFSESAGRVFAQTPVSEFLRAGVPGSQRDLLIFMGSPFHFKVWSAMSYSIATGKPAVEHLYGKPAFEAILEEPEVAYDFNTAMTSFSRNFAPALLEAYDFSGIGTLMDVAGGHGAILCEVLSRYPRMNGILFDMPNVIDEATCHICELKMDNRCRTIKGNFFEAIPAGADAYYLQHIIHDWADEPALKILANCRRALEGRRNGRLIIADAVVSDSSESYFNRILDLEMLLFPGGRERTEPEWKDLLGKAGFEIARIVSTKSPMSLIEARLNA